MLENTERIAFIEKPVRFKVKDKKNTAAKPMRPITSAFSTPSPAQPLMQPRTKNRNKNVAQISCKKFNPRFFFTGPAEKIPALAIPSLSLKLS